MGLKDLFGIRKETLEQGEIDGIPFEVNLIGEVVSGDMIDPKKNTDGSAPTDDKGEYDATTSKSVKITLPETQESCVWAYEHDDMTYVSVKKLAGLVNTGFEEVINDIYKDDTKVKEALPRYKKEVSEVLTEKIEPLVINMYMHSFAFLKKLYSKDKKLVGCLEFDSTECKPIRNLSTGLLGGKIGKGLNNKKQNDEIALVQKGHIAKYDTEGEQILTDTNFYFKRKEIIPFSIYERGKFIGISPVMRMLKTISTRQTIINVAELVIRRFGPQIVVTVGNKDVNFNGREIPAKYVRDSITGNPVDRGTAKANYRQAVMNNVKTKIQNWANTDTLVHIQEYGYSVETLNPSAALPDYIRFINTFGQQIKNGILGLFVEGRVDITSAVMQESVMRDLSDTAKDMRKYMIKIFNDEYSNEWLVNNDLPVDAISLKLLPMDKSLETIQANIEKTRSEIVKNFAQGGYEVPNKMIRDWGLEDLKVLPPEHVVQKTRGQVNDESTPKKE